MHASMDFIQFEENRNLSQIRLCLIRDLDLVATLRCVRVNVRACFKKKKKKSERIKMRWSYCSIKRKKATHASVHPASEYEERSLCKYLHNSEFSPKSLSCISICYALLAGYCTFPFSCHFLSVEYVR